MCNKVNPQEEHLRLAERKKTFSVVSGAPLVLMPQLEERELHVRNIVLVGRLLSHVPHESAEESRALCLLVWGMMVFCSLPPVPEDTLKKALHFYYVCKVIIYSTLIFQALRFQSGQNPITV